MGVNDGPPHPLFVVRLLKGVPALEPPADDCRIDFDPPEPPPAVELSLLG